MALGEKTNFVGGGKIGGDGRSGRTDLGTVAIIIEIAGVRMGLEKLLCTGESGSTRSLEFVSLFSIDAIASASVQVSGNITE
jgi:hypothetical protein